ncbi:1616_t:CDS:2 [Funneliformis geosporum]|uniref:1616_t:CDS:1 n=1 Tax=Funneliformis geosporum TaxID=1117311 RepID=A0A9W4WJJ5_9GLOM|nr:1616_t:CDS:2 [Funneliformis geosporum]
MTSLKLFDRLSEDVGKLVEKGENYDMIIQVGEKDVKEFKAHSLIISARSLYFKSALNNNWTTIKDGRFFFKKPNISPKIFQLILKYLYTGVVDFQGQELNQIFELMIAADELLLEELTDQIQEYLIKHKPLQIQRNIVLVLHTVFGHDVVVFQKLQDYSLKIINIVAYFMLSDYRPKSLLLPPRYSPNTGLESLLITIESFLFYIENKDLANAKLSRILPHRSSKAVFYDTSCGPNFGAPDLRISNNCNKNTLSFFSTTNFYENSVSIGNFSVIDYEL